ncbi:MAG TPA: TetR/AcrR family transcriptional regulator [Aquifex aeolicus]|uniref:TetR/AcrR family transcriptional regulator n=1 Tax=Aquifex aeolicus TaxID=63363 RepID=A0A7C5QLH4_AQUAO|nr:TetR/AcrR family transcriptional regulator [Aquifex aeolicus]
MARTRDLILEEALKLFSEKGIKETTVRDIARAVGITEGAIYRHFESKDQIVHELFEKYSGELYDRIEKALRDSGDEEGKFKRVVEAFLDFAFRKPDAFRYMNIFHHLRGKEVKRIRKIPFNLLSELIGDLHRKGILKMEPEYALAVVTGTLERVFLYKSMGIIRGRKKEIREKTAELLWKGLVECGGS